MIRDFFWLTEDQFVRLKPLLPTDTRGKPRVDDRRVISGIVHALKSGGRWIDAPAVYGPRKTLYNRFVRWAAKGVWADIFHALASAGGPPEEVLIDSSAVAESAQSVARPVVLFRFEPEIRHDNQVQRFHCRLGRRGRDVQRRRRWADCPGIFQ
jgi:transposase